MKRAFSHTFSAQAGNVSPAAVAAFILMGMLLVPDLAMAQAGSFGEAESKVTGFFSSLNSLLNVASISVVTIAVIFSGYQIAFAHKRISDVAPVLIGGFLIGAAAQIAKMLMGDDSTLPGIIIQTIPLF